ncbi:MAG: hypothetical protein AB7E95_06775 [Kiritimatiellales bacterium]
MSQTNVKAGPISVICGADLSAAADRLAVLSHVDGTAQMALPDSLTALALYLILEGAVAGERGSFQPLPADRNVRVPLVGTCNPGDRLVLADPAEEGQSGKVTVLPEAAGTYRIVAIAEEKGIDGQLVLMRSVHLGLITVEEEPDA